MAVVSHHTFDGRLAASTYTDQRLDLLPDALAGTVRTMSDDVRRQGELEAENAALRRIVAPPQKPPL